MFSQKIFADCAVGYCGVNRRSTIIQWSMLSSSVVQIIGLIIIVVIILSLIGLFRIRMKASKK